MSMLLVVVSQINTRTSIARIQIIIIMNWLKSWFHRGANAESKKQQHEHTNITDFCCYDFCDNSREVCDGCRPLHKGHIMLDIKEYKRKYENARRDIECRKKIEGAVRQFHQTLVRTLEDILEKQTQKFMAEIDQKVYNKNFMQIYKKYLAQNNFYSCLPNYEMTMGSDFYDLLEKNIKQREQKFLSGFKLIIDECKFLIKEETLARLPKARDGIINQTKIDKIKSLMSFQCNLIPKFQASRHRFQTNNLHKLGLRGPIVLVAESYKGRLFGGYTPKMFPKNETYEEDNRGRSFLFSVDHRVRMPIREEFKKFAIKGGSNLWFGRGDLVIADECNKGNISWAQIGRAYQLPPGLNGNTDEWLAGALYFQVVEYEIYEVQTSSFGTK